MWMLGYIYKNQSNFDTMYAESAKWFKNYLQFPFVKKDFASKGPEYVFSDSNVEVVLTYEEIPETAIGKLGLSYQKG